MPDKQVKKSLELFAREVHPAIRELGITVTEPAAASVTAD
jgi:hypothetical protein